MLNKKVNKNKPKRRIIIPLKCWVKDKNWVIWSKKKKSKRRAGKISINLVFSSLNLGATGQRATLYLCFLKAIIGHTYIESAHHTCIKFFVQYSKPVILIA